MEDALNIRKFVPARVRPFYWKFLKWKQRAIRFIERFYLNFREAKIEDYMRMQRKYYIRNARKSAVAPGNLIDDHVVGSWRQHDEWTDYETFLMKYVHPADEYVALDFGCGPGRNIRRWSNWFKRIDGADISKVNIANARVFLQDQVSDAKSPNLFVTNGADCGDAPSNSYDFVFSTVCLQHICSHSVRFAILTDLYRVLKPGGRISIQMGFGSPSPMTVGYFEDNFSAEATNRSCDTEISDVSEPKSDFDKIGFQNFESWIRPVGPGDIHPSWVYMTATKPL
jgi:ubiquinone/menaquinone biosynthesis C-methylase UbiE